MRHHPLRATNKSTTFGALGLLALVSVVVALGSGHRSRSVNMLSGNAWLVSNKKGQIVRVNAATGQPDAGVQIGKPGKYQVEQDGDFVIVRDANGVVRRIDTRNLTAGGAQSYGKRFNVVIGGGAAYAVDMQNGVVRRLDPNTLVPRGKPIHLSGALSDAEVDSFGQLWAMVSSAGRVVEVGPRGIEGSHTYGPPGDRGFLSLVGTDVVVIDTTASTIGTVGSGNVHMADLGTSGPVLAPEKTETGPLWLLASASEELVRYSPGHAPTTLPLRGANGDDLGAPELVGANLYLPDFTTGSLVRVDTATGAVVQTIPFLHHAGTFDVFVSGGSLWANNDDGSAALVIDQNGHAHEVSKYRSDVPGLDKPSNQTHRAAPPSPAPSNQAAAPNTVGPPTASAPFGGFPAPSSSPGSAPAAVNTGPPTGQGPAPVVAGPPVSGPVTAPFPRPTAPQPRHIPVPTAPRHTAPPTATTTPPPRAQAPSAPTVTATPGDQQVTAQWTVPAANGSKITRYDVAISPNPKTGSNPQTVPAGQTSATFTGLSDGTAYTVLVRAQSNAGPSQWGQSAPVTPKPGTPPTPQISSARPGVGSIAVAWTGDTLGGSDKVTATQAPLPAGCQLGQACGTAPTGSAAATVDPATSPTTLTSLASGRVYGVQVTATGKTGGTASSETWYVQTPGAPGSAPEVSASANKIKTGSTIAAVTVTINPPADNGGTPVTGYTVTGDLGTRTINSGGQQSFTVNEPHGTYNVYVSATNQVGSGPQASRAVIVSYAGNYQILVDNTDSGGFQWNGPTTGTKYASFTDGYGQVHNNYERTTKTGHQSVGGSYYTTVNDLLTGACRGAGSPGQRTSATWTANLPSGRWQVEVFIPVPVSPIKVASDWEWGPAGGSVEYKLGGQTIAVAQGQNAGKWVPVGTVGGGRSSTLTVTDQDTVYSCSGNQTATYISIDAARWVPA